MTNSTNEKNNNIPWLDILGKKDYPIIKAPLKIQASIVGRVGLMLLACGTGAWRVKEAMSKLANKLNLVCSADIGLTAISFTCFSKGDSYSQTLVLAKSGVNTDKLNSLEGFIKTINENMTVSELHKKLSEIQKRAVNYNAIQLGFAAAFACSAFVFLLGGGLVEMICCFLGAGVGNWLRSKMLHRKWTLLAAISASVATACFIYLISFHLLVLIFHVTTRHEVGYIGSMLFIVPGFPFITSMLDLAKQDLRSGLERLFYALLITVVASLVGWLAALLGSLKPGDFIPLGLPPLVLMIFRIVASFAGVYGFSIMFNSPIKMAFLSGIIGSIANTLRLELVDWTKLPPAAAAFFGALLAGLLASAINRVDGFPRITLTVPSIVIMVPGLYIYRAVYNIGLNNLSVGSSWLTKAVLIIMFLPLGLFAARLIMDKNWRLSD